MLVRSNVLTQISALNLPFDSIFSAEVDFLFFTFDHFTIEEKKVFLLECVTQDGEEEQAEEKNVTIHPLLEKRLEDLTKECEELTSVSDAVLFLIHVLRKVHPDDLPLLITKYFGWDESSDDLTSISGRNPTDPSVDPHHFETPTRNQPDTPAITSTV